MSPMRLLALVTTVAITACTGASDDAAGGSGAVIRPPVRSAPAADAATMAPVPVAPIAPPPVPVEAPEPARGVATAADQLIRDGLARSDAGTQLRYLVASYVHADGTIDTTYGELVMQFERDTRPADDPNRPIGAPVREPADHTHDSCAAPSWKAGAWTVSHTSCRPMHMSGRDPMVPPHCPLAEIWRRAIGDGAPPTALAVLTLVTAGAHAPQGWQLAVDDSPRGIHFSHRYADDCAVHVEAEAIPRRPVTKPPQHVDPIDDPFASPHASPAVAESLSAEMVRHGIAATMPQVKACAASGASGMVKLAVTVAPNGHVTDVKVASSTDAALASCAAAVMRRATFEATVNGGTFTYPVSFSTDPGF